MPRISRKRSLSKSYEMMCTQIDYILFVLDRGSVPRFRVWKFNLIGDGVVSIGGADSYLHRTILYKMF